jgi:hypothetical protein
VVYRFWMLADFPEYIWVSSKPPLDLFLALTTVINRLVNAFGVFIDFYKQEYLSNYSPTLISMIGSVQVFVLYLRRSFCLLLSDCDLCESMSLTCLYSCMHSRGSVRRSGTHTPDSFQRLRSSVLSLHAVHNKATTNISTISYSSSSV